MIIRKLDINNCEKLNNYLTKVDKDFPIPLSSKVNLDKFSKKILKSGVALACFDGERTAGIILFYANNTESKTAYVSVLSVLDSYRKRGIAQSLLNECIKMCKSINFKAIELYTHKTNEGAIALYEKNGFIKISDLDRPDDWLMRYNLGE